MHKRFYKPREIARLGLITNYNQSDNEDSNYIFIINEIKHGNLEAKNYGKASRKYFVVTAKEIKRYNAQRDKRFGL